MWIKETKRADRHPPMSLVSTTHCRQRTVAQESAGASEEIHAGSEPETDGVSADAVSETPLTDTGADAGPEPAVEEPAVEAEAPDTPPRRYRPAQISASGRYRVEAESSPRPTTPAEAVERVYVLEYGSRGGRPLRAQRGHARNAGTNSPGGGLSFST